VTIRVLDVSDLPAFQQLRQQALTESPQSFVSTYEEESAIPSEVQRLRIERSQDRCIVGAFDEAALTGVAGIRRDEKRKLAHKAMLWGVYVVPQARGRGVGRSLIAEALKLAAGLPGVRTVYLGVNATNSRAIALYESFGFTTFGFEKGFMMLDGELHDELYMSVGVSKAQSHWRNSN